MTLQRLIQSDLARFRQTFWLRGVSHASGKVALESLIFKSGFRAVLLYRLGHWFYQSGHVYVAWWFTRRSVRSTGAEIEFNASIGPGLMIAHPSGVVIGRGTEIGSNATIFQGVSFGARSWHPDEIREFPRVGNNCFFFAQSTVIGNISIGDYCLVGANTLVNRNMPAGSMALGVPARIIPDRGMESIRLWFGVGKEDNG